MRTVDHSSGCWSARSVCAGKVCYATLPPGKVHLLYKQTGGSTHRAPSRNTLWYMGLSRDILQKKIASFRGVHGKETRFFRPWMTAKPARHRRPCRQATLIFLIISMQKVTVEMVEQQPLRSRRVAPVVARMTPSKAGDGSVPYARGMTSSQRPSTASGRRIVCDAAHTAAYPLAALGAVTRRLDRPEHEVGFPEIGWRVVTRRGRLSGKLPSATIYDVLVALLYTYQAVGTPVDGVVPFSRRALIGLMRWVPPGQRPTGRHYTQLADALWHLQHIELTWGAENSPPQLNDYRGVSVTASLVADFRLADEPVGRRTSDVAAPMMTSWVRFDPRYLTLLQCPYARLEFDLDRMMALSSGVARVLFRALMWYRHRGVSVVTLRQLFARIGSSTDRYTPAQARELLGRAHREMVDTGVLRRDPVYRRCKPGELGGLAEYGVTYDFGPDETLSPEDEALVRAARKHGVSKPMALRLLEHRDQLRLVLRAVEAGRVAPRYPAGYIVEATRGGWSL